MKRLAATSAYVRSWSLPSLWRKVLQTLVNFLLRLSWLPRPRLLDRDHSNEPGGSGGSTISAAALRRNLKPASEADVDLGEYMRGADDAAGLPSACSRVGLVNTGNTCFVNAVVQCLVALPGLVDRLDEEMEGVLRESDGHGAREHVQQLRLAMSLVELMKGLVPESEEVEDRDRDQNSTADPGTHEENETTFAIACIAEDQMTRGISPRAGKKRKRASPRGDRSANAEVTTKRLRGFLKATSKCSDLVNEVAGRQEQQDAEEFLLFLLDTVHELLVVARPVDAQSATAKLIELNRLVDVETECLQHLKKCLVTEPATYNTTVCYLSDIRWHRYLKENRSFITDMFAGQIVRGSQCCSCANLTCLHQEFRVLSLSIDASAASQKIENCLAMHRHLEDLVDDNRVFCDVHCQNKTSRRTQVLIQRAPETLVIQLQRFKHTKWCASPEKIATAVQFPIADDALLDLTNNMFMRDPTRPVLYALQAVCAHIGSALDAGHYWMKFDDDVVTTMQAEDVQRETQSTAYLLFYRRIECAPGAADRATEAAAANAEALEEEEEGGGLEVDENTLAS